MRYGWVIDDARCMGCHACSVACKSEQRVPLGVFRTWVKYVEKGRYPSVRRHFQVLRCNHCEKPPCVRVCPVGAMAKRPDGIVDFDSERCVGCKACQQACPYDAIYEDPERHTAAKCNYCAHRVTRGLEPACAAACPQRALIPGDLDDPESEATRLLARGAARVRRPERGTGPSVFYLAAEDATLDPLASRHVGAYVWAEANLAKRPLALDAGAAAPDAALCAYDVEHARGWGWEVPAFCAAKAIAAGALLIPALCLLGVLPCGSPLPTFGLVNVAMVALAASVGLMVLDLGRKERFLSVLTRGQRFSWLSRGAWLLIAYSAALGALWLASLFGAEEWARLLLVPGAVLGVSAGVYTAFLLRQCEGRELWHSPLLPLDVLARCVAAGAGTLALFAPFRGDGAAGELARLAAGVLAGSLAVHGALLGLDLLGTHPSPQVRRAMELLVLGPQRRLFLGAGVALGIAAPLALLTAFFLAPTLPPESVAAAGLLVLAGGFAYEHSHVMAAQGVRNS